jgi:hypothetical protein
MQCPCCTSEIDDQSLVCKVCHRDLYLFKPLLEKISKLELELLDKPDPAVAEQRIEQLELKIEQLRRQVQVVPSGPLSLLRDILIYLIFPLLLLMTAHTLLVVVMDAQVIYLRIISMTLPLPFGVWLFLNHKRDVLPWFLGTAALAIFSVIGMSWITSLVDQTPILPQNAFEWWEYLEYSASISFSFVTGMLIGGIIQAKKHQLSRRSKANDASSTSFRERVLRTAVNKTMGNFLSPTQIHTIMSKLEEFGSTAIALGTTAMSIYTGLKGFLS